MQRWATTNCLPSMCWAEARAMTRQVSRALVVLAVTSLAACTAAPAVHPQSTPPRSAPSTRPVRTRAMDSSRNTYKACPIATSSLSISRQTAESSQDEIVVLLTNRGEHSCTVKGYMRVLSVTLTDGKTVRRSKLDVQDGSTYFTNSSHPRSILLNPGGRAQFVIATTTGFAHATRITSLRLATFSWTRAISLACELPASIPPTAKPRLTITALTKR